jgi:hypothetical protein
MIYCLLRRALRAAGQTRHGCAVGSLELAPLCSSLHVLWLAAKKGTALPSLIPDFATLQRSLAGLPVVKHLAREIVLNGRFKDGLAAFPQEWHCRGH